MTDLQKLYLDLLKRTVLNLIYLGAEGDDEDARREKREVGSDRPAFALSMMGVKRIDNLIHAVETIVAENIPGDLIETGVWRGGAAAVMAGALEAFGDKNRLVWLADSFQGLPPPDPRYPADAGDTLWTETDLAVSRNTVEANLRRFGFSAERFRFIEGFFEDSLPKAPVGTLALLRLDGDMYGSTMASLTALYDKVSIGGFIIVDDYGCYPSCKQAVEDFLSARGLSVTPQIIDWTGAYWRKTA